MDALRRIGRSGRAVDVLVGAAGTGKTTTLRALRAAWEAEHGRSSVLGLAPSATAAEVLADRLGVATDNTAKWLHESVGPGARHRANTLHHWQTVAANGGGRGQRARTDEGKRQVQALRAEQDRWRLDKNHLVILDEASLDGTLTLATIARQAEEAGAKLLLVGDDAQLSAVDAGGAFRLLAKETNAAELTGIWRFQHAWERDASLRLRDGDHRVLDTYAGHGRISDGDHATMADAAYHAWLSDTRTGKASLLLAVDADTVSNLNRRARIDRIKTGEVEADGVRLTDGTEASVGDRIVTRLNARRLLDSTGRSVRNGTAWTVTQHWADGSLTAARDDGATVTLPAAYVVESVELGYAATVHRAQGTTVDSAHLLARPGITREGFYVGMTRGRQANHAYVATADESPENHQQQPPQTAHEVLTGILSHTGTERSATETMRDELNAAGSLARLVPMYEHMAQAAAADRWQHRLTDASLDPDDIPAVVASPAWPALVAALRRADAQGLDTDTLLTASVNRAGLGDAHDITAVLHRRLRALVDTARHRGDGHDEATVVGLISPAQGIHDTVMATALGEVEDLICRRANELTHQAIDETEPWLTHLGPKPAQPQAQAEWEQAVTIVAAYRERHGITTKEPLGPVPSKLDHTHNRDRQRVARAVRSVQAGVRRSGTSEPQTPAYAPPMANPPSIG